MTADTLPVACSWCNCTISGSPIEGQPISHGICPECLDGLMGELKEGMPFKITNYGGVEMAHTNGVHVPDVQPADGPPVVKTLGDLLREDQAASPYDPAWSERFVPVERDAAQDSLMSRMEDVAAKMGWQGSEELQSLALYSIARSLATLAGWRAGR